jgi:hypothetical protein
MRCKSCGFIWNVSFRNLEARIVESAEPQAELIEPAIALAKEP